MTHDLATMTQAVWDSLTQADRERLRDTSKLHHRLRPYVGERVEVTYAEPVWPCLTGGKPNPTSDDDGKVTRERFQVGQSTGWRPSLIALHSRASMGGDLIPAALPVASVRVV